MYLLDTNVLSELIRLRPYPLVESRFEFEPAPLFTSVICVDEIRYGSKIGPPGNKLWERSQAQVFPWLTILPVNEALALSAADLRAEWKIKGTPLGYGDSLIAATAKANGLTLVTCNVRHFSHITGLRVENWFEVATI